METQIQGQKPSLELNGQFMQALDLLENTKQNVFITGKAGTGKSTFLHYFRGQTKKNLVVLAPTGVAAVNIAGQTIHSFFRFLPNITLKEAEKSAKQSKNIVLFRQLQMIVIDEVSMVRADLLDCVDVFLRTIRRRPNEPFGGIQMVFIGDLYQLPPVVTSHEKEIFSRHYPSPYFFDSQVMEMLTSPMVGRALEFIELEKIYRQHEAEFIHLLNAIRNKTITDEQIEKLNERHLEIEDIPDEYIYLTAINQQADEINRRNLDRLPGQTRHFTGAVSGEFDEKYLPTDIRLSVKINSRIMLLNNDSQGRWINGTLGTIMSTSKDAVSVKLNHGKTVTVEPYTWTMYRSRYNTSTREIENEEMGSFTQFPLRLAWAITIHKSQGKTFDKVVIDVGRGTFAHGQMYVALSRCRSYKGIILKTPIKKGHILMDYRVVQFLTRFQYHLSRLASPLEQKVNRIRQAIENKQKLNITYLKAGDEKSKRTVLPENVSEMEYQGRSFVGMEAYCFMRQNSRVFNVERILEISEA